MGLGGRILKKKSKTSNRISTVNYSSIKQTEATKKKTTRISSNSVWAFSTWFLFIYVKFARECKFHVPKKCASSCSWPKSYLSGLPKLLTSPFSKGTIRGIFRSTKYIIILGDSPVCFLPKLFQTVYFRIWEGNVNIQ